MHSETRQAWFGAFPQSQHSRGLRAAWNTCQDSTSKKAKESWGQWPMTVTPAQHGEANSTMSSSEAQWAWDSLGYKRPCLKYKTKRNQSWVEFTVPSLILIWHIKCFHQHAPKGTYGQRASETSQCILTCHQATKVVRSIATVSTPILDLWFYWYKKKTLTIFSFSDSRGSTQGTHSSAELSCTLHPEGKQLQSPKTMAKMCLVHKTQMLWFAIFCFIQLQSCKV